MAAELEELPKSQVWVDELAYTAEKGALIQQVREFIMSLTHLHHVDFDVRFRQKLTKRWPLRLVMTCKRRPPVRCPEIQVHVPHRTPGSGFGARRAWTAHILGTIFYKFWLRTSGLFGKRLQNTDWSCVPYFRTETFCRSMVRPGCQSCVGCYFKNIEALCVHVS